MNESRIGVKVKSCDNCMCWGMDEDNGTYRKCLIKNEHVSCNDCCEYYMHDKMKVNDNKGETEWNT